MGKDGSCTRECMGDCEYEELPCEDRCVKKCGGDRRCIQHCLVKDCGAEKETHCDRRCRGSCSDIAVTTPSPREEQGQLSCESCHAQCHQEDDNSCQTLCDHKCKADDFSV